MLKNLKTTDKLRNILLTHRVADVSRCRSRDSEIVSCRLYVKQETRIMPTQASCLR